MDSESGADVAAVLGEFADTEEDEIVFVTIVDDTVSFEFNGNAAVDPVVVKRIGKFLSPFVLDRITFDCNSDVKKLTLLAVDSNCGVDFGNSAAVTVLGEMVDNEGDRIVVVVAVDFDVVAFDCNDDVDDVVFVVTFVGI